MDSNRQGETRIFHKCGRVEVYPVGGRIRKFLELVLTIFIGAEGSIVTGKEPCSLSRAMFSGSWRLPVSAPRGRQGFL